MAEVVFKVLSKKECISSITQFFCTSCKPFGRMQEYIAYNFNLDLAKLEKLDEEERIAFLNEVLSPVYHSCLKKMEQKREEIEKLFNENKEKIFSILENVFGCKLNRTITCGVMFNTTCPRYLSEFAFEVNYNTSNEQMLETIIHELIHFYYFEKWKEVFPDYDESTFECPHLIWLLSEMSIEPLFKKTAFNSFCLSPYPAYNYFYSECLFGENVMEKLNTLFSSNNITSYFKEALKYIYENEDFFKKLTN